MAVREFSSIFAFVMIITEKLHTKVVFSGQEKNCMYKIRISAVRYANTYPFIYGMTESGFDKKVIVETDHPADCAQKLITGKVDIGLVPVAALKMIGEYHLITDYCLGAYGNVGPCFFSVTLLLNL